MRIEIHVHHHHDRTADLVRELRGDVHTLFRKLEESNVAKKEEVLAKLGELNTAITKVGEETGNLVNEVQRLRDQVAGNGDVPQEIVDSVDGLLASVKRVDDMVPDPLPPGEVETGGDTSNG